MNDEKNYLYLKIQLETIIENKSKNKFDWPDKHGPLSSDFRGDI